MIDDRDAGQKEPSNGEANKAGDIEGDAPDDLRPLSSSEVSRLGVNTVSYVMDSANPLDTLVKLSQEAVDLLSHKLLGESLEQDAPQRYNYRDETEGGKVLIWLNDLEKDAKYDSWPSELGAVSDSI